MDQELISSLQILNDNLKDLEKWSAYHDDLYNEELDELRTKFVALFEAVKSTAIKEFKGVKSV